MPIMMLMNWYGIRKEQYESLRKTVNWEGNVPKGAIFHVSGFDEAGIHVVDLWNNAEDFDAFAQTRLMPEVAKLGITSQPNVVICPVHATFTPEYVKK